MCMGWAHSSSSGNVPKSALTYTMKSKEHVLPIGFASCWKQELALSHSPQMLPSVHEAPEKIHCVYDASKQAGIYCH